MKRKILLAFFASLSIVTAASGGAGIEGTYSDDPGSLMLELKPGGKATFTDNGNMQSCTYVVNGKQVSINCPGESGQSDFAIHDDGSLTMLGSPFPMPAMRKRTQ